MNFNEEQLDILGCLIENEIESDTNYLEDISGKEKEFYKSHILKLIEIKQMIII